jgi:hypothetical protein
MTITGVVLSAALGETLPNAHVWVVRDGRMVGTTTNLDGAYALDVEPGEMLNVSYTGHEPETMLITEDSDRAPIEHILEAVTLDEFEVVADRPRRTGILGLLALAIAAAVWND